MPCFPWCQSAHTNPAYSRLLLLIPHAVLLLRRVLATRRKSLLVLPFVAVVREKVAHLRKLLASYNTRRVKREAIRVREFHGGKGGKGFGTLPCVVDW